MEYMRNTRGELVPCCGNPPMHNRLLPAPMVTRKEVEVETNSLQLEVGILSLDMEFLDSGKDYKEYLEKKKTTSYGGYNYSASNSPYYPNGNGINSSHSDFRTVYFYEFSDVTRSPKVFTKVSEFLAWARDNKVNVTSYLEGTMKTQPVSFVTCYKGYNTIMIRQSYKDLKDSVERQANYNINRANETYQQHWHSDWD